MTLKSFTAATIFSISSLSAFASKTSFTEEPQSSHMILLGLSLMAVIVWRRFKSSNS